MTPRELSRARLISTVGARMVERAAQACTDAALIFDGIRGGEDAAAELRVKANELHRVAGRAVAQGVFVPSDGGVVPFPGSSGDAA